MIPDEVKRMKPLTGKERLGAERDSEYMGAEDIDPETEPVLTIKAIYTGMVTLSRGKEKKDFIVFEEETVPGIKVVRPLIVNATNRKTLRKLYKSVNAETLQGKKIKLFLQHDVRDPSTGDKVDGIRIRPTIPSSTAPATPKCAVCGKVITGLSGFTPEQIAATNQQRYGKPMCIECGRKYKEEKEKAAAEASKQAEEAAREAKTDTDDDDDAMLKALQAEV